MTSLACLAGRIPVISQSNRRIFISEKGSWLKVSPFNHSTGCHGVKTVAPSDESPLDGEDNQPDTDRILKLRNISRLRPDHRNIVNRTVPSEEKTLPVHFTAVYNKRMFGRYGYASGVNPSICWPTKAELIDKKEYEEVAYPYSIKEITERESAKKADQEREILERDAYVEENYHKMLTMKKQFLDKLEKQKTEAEAAKAFKTRLIEEVRLHFNYTINERDERFRLEVKERAKQLREKEKFAKKTTKKEKIALEKAAKFEYEKRKLKEAEEKRAALKSSVAVEG